MTHYDAETLEEVAYDTLTERYDDYLDNSGEYDISIDGNDLIPSEVLKSTDPTAYDESLNNYINSLYDAGELTSQWDRDAHINELCNDWAFDVLGALLDHTTTAEEDTIYKTLYRLYTYGALELDSGEIVLSSQHTMAEVLVAIGTALDKTKNNKND